MGNKKREHPGVPATVSRGREDVPSTQKLRYRAQQLDALEKVAAREETEITRSQRNFLDDFASRLTKNAVDDEPTSSES